MTREEMMDMVIKKYGFETKKTITFCKMCENETNNDEKIIEAFRKMFSKKEK